MANFQAHHRSDARLDPAHTWRRRCAYRLSTLCAAVRALDRLLAMDWPGAPPCVQAQRLAAKAARDKCWPLVIDEDGRAWE